MKTTRTLIPATLLLLAFTGCREAADPASAAPTRDRPLVATVNHPLETFATRIAGDLVEVTFPAPEDVDPADWQPAPEALLIYQNADLILLNGASHSGWTTQASLPVARTVDTSAAFHDRLIASAHTLTHSHGPEGDHEHHIHDFQTWLDPSLARLHAEAVHQALAKLLPDHAESLNSNAQALDRELAAIETAFEELFNESKPQFIASHPVYSHFAHRFDLDLANLHWEPDEMPDAGEWAHLAELVAGHPAAIMLWEDEPLPAIRERSKAMNLPIAVFRTAAQRTPDGDLPATMKANLDRLKSAMR